MEEDRLYALDEYIKILKEFINYKDKSNLHFQLVAISHERLCESIEHLIEAYRKVKEEELHWKGQYHLLSRKIDVIPKSKIKEKIEELDKEEKEAQNSISDEERERYSDASIGYLLMDIETRRRVLQELLEEE